MPTIPHLTVSPLAVFALTTALVLSAAPAAAAGGPAPAATGELTRFELLGEAVIPKRPPAGVAGEEDAADAPVGGLSALLYEPETGDYLAVSDDGAVRGPARFYTLEIDLDAAMDGAGDDRNPRLDPEGARITGVTEILDAGGRSFRPRTVDPEGLAFAPGGPGGGLYVSSEGRVKRGAAPFVRLYDRDGRMRTEMPVPAYYLPEAGLVEDGPVEDGRDRGVRHNMGFESLTVTPAAPSGTPRFLFSATENALLQDGPEATVAGGSPARLLRWELGADGSAAGPPTEWIYPVDPVALPPREPDAVTVAGLVELLAVSPETLLALERSYTEGAGTVVRLYRVDLSEATEVTGRASVRDDLLRERIRPAAKTLLLDLAQDLAQDSAEPLEASGIPLDNVEGMTFGPELTDPAGPAGSVGLGDGRRTLLLVSDDNFSDTQRTQVLAFAVDDAPVSISAIQGRAHRSPLKGEWVRGVRGVVTVVDPGPASDGEPGRFWIQAPEGEADDDPGTSEGLAVRLREGESTPLPGTLVELAGRVTERGFPGALTVTTLDGARVRTLGDAPVPEPVVLRAGTLPTETIDDDGLTTFDPVGEGADGIDRWEALEGMRVAVPAPVVVGPTTRYGGFAVLPDGGAGASLRTCAGGLVARPDDFNPERILVATDLVEEAPSLRVGEHLSAPLVGVVDYDYGNFRLLPTDPVAPAVRPGPATGCGGPATVATSPAGSLKVATYNVLNLHPGSGDERFRRVAGHIVLDLGAPDLVALQEIQDASGPADDGVVAGGPTFERLIEAIEEVGGPAYTYRQVDPVDGTEGGQPGGNIRVGFLVRPDRLEITGLPRRIAPDHPCFTGSEAEGYEPTRRSLALEVRFGPRKLLVIDNHWKSKRGDDRLFGAVQPPVLHTEAQRTCQARVVADFVRGLLAADPDAWVIVTGDLNEHEFRPPLDELEATGLVNLMHRIPRTDRYTYNFEGNSQVLDHLLVSPGLLRDAVVIPRIVHVNADLPADEAASDHEPVLAVLVPREGAPDETEPPPRP